MLIKGQFIFQIDFVTIYVYLLHMMEGPILLRY